MPDWSYRTLLRPALFALPAGRARGLTIGASAALAEAPGGARFIEAFGDLTPPPELATTLAGVHLRSPIGLGAGIDVAGRAARAWEGLGFGFIEVGPVTREPVADSTAIDRDLRSQGFLVPALPVNPGVDSVARALTRAGPWRAPLAIRLAWAPAAGARAAAAEQREVARVLRSFASWFVVDWTRVLCSEAWDARAWSTYLRALVSREGDPWSGVPVFAAIPAAFDPAALEDALPWALAAGIRGFVVDAWLPSGDGRRLVGTPAFPAAIATVRAVRRVTGDAVAIVASGVTEPIDALALMDAGASAVQVSSGLVYAGPTLPRRTGETILAARDALERSAIGQDGDGPQASGPRVRPRGSGTSWRHDWPWAALLGAGMVVAGILAWLVAIVRVVLPYDEAFLGLSREQITRVNPRVLSFMAHDRVTLAGTMISIGVMYAGLALGGMRMGRRWARRAFVVSAGTGFATFALVLGYRYVDPLHVLAALLLLPSFLLAVRGKPAPWRPPRADLRNDAAWLRAQWGQLLLVALGVGFVVGGITIATVGVTDVFVREDLAYMGVVAPVLRAANPHLVPLIAHDRAGFGGALLSDGVAFVLTALWGVRRGAGWVWWTLLVAGMAGFVPTIGVHLAVGYDNPIHLAPVALGLAMWGIGLALCRAYCLDAPWTGGAAQIHAPGAEGRADLVGAGRER